MRPLKPLLLVLLLIYGLPVSADNEFHHDPIEKKPTEPMQVDESTSITRDILPELIIRPMGFLGSVAGAAFFVAGSPFSGLASIPEPHDAFKKTYQDFVLTPFEFTFRRPLGKYEVPIYDKQQ